MIVTRNLSARLRDRGANAADQMERRARAMSAAADQETRSKLNSRPNHLLDYRKCSYEELCNFIATRGGKPTAPTINTRSKRGRNPTKSHRLSLYRTLLRMDEDASFRFSDLPPEMRNLIYTELLIRDRDSARKADTAILQVSHQIYKEALGILHAESIIYLNVSLQAELPVPADHFRTSIKSTAEITGDLQLHIIDNSVNYNVVTLESLAKVQTLQLGVSLFSVGDVCAGFRCFSTLVSLVVANFRNLKVLRILVDADLDQRLGQEEQQELIVAALAALEKFSAKVTVDLVGLEEGTYDAVWEKIGDA